MVSPEDVMKMIKSGKLRRPSNVPPGANSMGPMAMQADPAGMTADEYRMQSCLQEINVVLRKYNCRMIPQISLDTVNGVRGVCAISVMPPMEQTLPMPTPAPEIPARSSEDEEEAARARIEALRAENLKSEEAATVPNEEA